MVIVQIRFFIFCSITDRSRRCQPPIGAAFVNCPRQSREIVVPCCRELCKTELFERTQRAQDETRQRSNGLDFVGGVVRAFSFSTSTSSFSTPTAAAPRVLRQVLRRAMVLLLPGPPAEAVLQVRKRRRLHGRLVSALGLPVEADGKVCPPRRRRKQWSRQGAPAVEVADQGGGEGSVGRRVRAPGRRRRRRRSRGSEGRRRSKGRRQRRRQRRRASRRGRRGYSLIM